MEYLNFEKERDFYEDLDPENKTMLEQLYNEAKEICKLDNSPVKKSINLNRIISTANNLHGLTEKKVSEMTFRNRFTAVGMAIQLGALLAMAVNLLIFFGLGLSIIFFAFASYFIYKNGKYLIRMWYKKHIQSNSLKEYKGFIDLLGDILIKEKAKIIEYTKLLSNSFNEDKKQPAEFINLKNQAEEIKLELPNLQVQLKELDSSIKQEEELLDEKYSYYSTLIKLQRKHIPVSLGVMVTSAAIMSNISVPPITVALLSGMNVAGLGLIAYSLRKLSQKDEVAKNELGIIHQRLSNHVAQREVLV